MSNNSTRPSDIARAIARRKLRGIAPNKSAEAQEAEAPLSATVDVLPAAAVLEAVIAAPEGVPAGAVVLEVAGEPATADVGLLTVDQPTAETAPQDAATADETVVELPPAESVPVPLDALRAALTTAGKKDTRYYLNGVLVHIVDGELRVVGSDGHRVMVVSRKLPAGKVPAWLEAGVVIPRDRLDGIVAYLGKSGCADCIVEFGIGHPSMRLRDDAGDTSFRVKPIEGGQYPDYQRIIASSGHALTGERRPLDTVAINPEYLKAAGTVAKHLESEAVFPFIPGDTGDEKNVCPAMFTFSGAPGVVLYIMPMRADEEAIAPETVRVLGKDGLKLSLAALKAHATRKREAAKKTTNKTEKAKLEAAAAALLKRIDELKGHMAPALPAPAKVEEGEAITADGAEAA